MCDQFKSIYMYGKLYWAPNQFCGISISYPEDFKSSIHWSKLISIAMFFIYFFPSFSFVNILVIPNNEAFGRILVYWKTWFIDCNNMCHTSQNWTTWNREGMLEMYRKNVHWFNRRIANKIRFMCIWNPCYGCLCVYSILFPNRLMHPCILCTGIGYRTWYVIERHQTLWHEAPLITL